MKQYKELNFSGYVSNLGLYRRLNGYQAYSDFEISSFVKNVNFGYTPPKGVIDFHGGFYDSSFFNKRLVEQMNKEEQVKLLSYIKLVNETIQYNLYGGLYG